MKSSNARVLVVDDDRLLVALLRTALEYEGYLVQSAFNGQEALNRTKEAPPHLILMDLGMPVMDGRTCYRLLRQHHETAKTPVILMSADPEGSSVQTELEADYFLPKPFVMEDLLSCVRRHLQREG